jgi:hypothetical protein
MLINDLSGDLDFANSPLVTLERLLGARFSVCSDRSVKAFEEFTMPDGEVVRLLHYVFGHIAKGRIDAPDMVSKLAEKMWDDLKRSWPPGTFLMWRRLPVLTEYEEAEDDWRITLTLRIGSFVPPAMPVDIPDGGLLHDTR